MLQYSIIFNFTDFVAIKIYRFKLYCKLNCNFEIKKAQVICFLIEQMVL